MLYSPVRIKQSARLTLICASVFMFLGVLLGAFGAHALKKFATPLQLETWETGTRYLLLHASALLALGVLTQITSLALNWPRRLLVLGVLGFSGNCFLYVLSGVKFFAMIVPIGGTLLLLGWVSMVWELCFFTRQELPN